MTAPSDQMTKEQMLETISDYLGELNKVHTLTMKESISYPIIASWGLPQLSPSNSRRIVIDFEVIE